MSRREYNYIYTIRMAEEAAEKSVFTRLVYDCSSFE